MNKKFLRIIMILAAVYAFNTKVLAEEYLTLERDEQSSGVEITQPGEDGSWDLFYDKENKKFHAAYNITSEAPDEVTLDLTSVYNLFNQYAVSSENLFNSCRYDGYSNREICRVTIGGIDIDVDKKSLTSDIVLQPGDRIAFVVTVKNSSGKAYVYKEDSLTIATPKQPETDSEIIGFDGQKLPFAITAKQLAYGYNQNMDDKNIINTLVDKVFDEYPTYASQMYVDSEGNLSLSSTEIKIEKDQSVIEFNGKYYYQVGNYYVVVNKYCVDTTTNKTKSSTTINGAVAYSSPGQKVYAKTDRKSFIIFEDRTILANSIREYLKKYYNGDLNNYIVAEFNSKYNTNYSTYADFTKNDAEKLFMELNHPIYITLGYYEIDGEESYKYNSFYNGLLNVVITSEEEYDEKYKRDDSWSYNNNGELTIGQYMDEKVNGIETGKYKETDKFLTETVGEVKNEETRSFVYATDLDGMLTGNSYQNYIFGHYASIKMLAKKGIVIINYVDEDGNILKKSEKVEYYYYDDYQTKAAIIDGYELIEIDGIEKGSIDKDETVVTYIYQFVLGEGGEEFDIVQTGKDIDYSLMSSAAITLSLIAIAIISKRKNNN